jgi:hypothetical protein
VESKRLPGISPGGCFAWGVLAAWFGIFFVFVYAGGGAEAAYQLVRALAGLEGLE